MEAGLEDADAFAALDTDGDFELTLKFKLVGDPKKANAGVQFRTRRIPKRAPESRRRP